MKVKQLLYATVTVMALGAVAGCSDREDVAALETSGDDVMLSELKTVIPDTATTVSLERAMEIASAYKGTAPQSRSTVGRVVETVETVTDEDGEPLLYVVNYAANQGFVILSAKKDYYPVLAENDEGHFEIPQTFDEHPAYMWLDEQKALLEHSAELPADVRKEAAGQWMSLNTRRSDLSRELASRAGDEKPQVYYDSLQRWSQDPNIEVYKYEDYVNTQEYQNLPQNVKNDILTGMHYAGNSNYGTIESSTIVLRREINDYQFYPQLTQSKWGQADLIKDTSESFGYNKYAPGKKMGCGPVAVGQIMYYHKYPSYIKWSSMSPYFPTDESAKFLKELGDKMEVTFEVDETSSDISDAIKGLEAYGYAAIKNSHSVSAVVNQIKIGNPICMYGRKKPILGVINNKGHVWVCDGASSGSSSIELRIMTIDYRPSSAIVPDLMVEAYSYNYLSSYTPTKFRMNWGWYGENNGWYTEDDIEVTVDGEKRDYNYNREDLFISSGK